AKEKWKTQRKKIEMKRTGGAKTDEILGRNGGPEGLPHSIIVTPEGTEGEAPVLPGVGPNGAAAADGTAASNGASSSDGEPSEEVGPPEESPTETRRSRRQAKAEEARPIRTAKLKTKREPNTAKPKPNAAKRKTKSATRK